MTPGGTDARPLQDPPINEVDDIQQTTSHFSSDTKPEKKREIFNQTPALALHETASRRRNPDRRIRAHRPAQLQSTLSDTRSYRKPAVPKGRAVRSVNAVARCPGATQCNKTFGVKTDAIRHWETNCIYNPNLRMIQCPLCVLPISTRRDCVIRHFRNKHGFTREAALDATEGAIVAMSSAPNDDCMLTSGASAFSLSPKQSHLV